MFDIATTSATWQIYGTTAPFSVVGVDFFLINISDSSIKLF